MVATVSQNPETCRVYTQNEIGLLLVLNKLASAQNGLKNELNKCNKVCPIFYDIPTHHSVIYTT
jgi:hypothetical protein